jgi:putative DNA primase/helicase
MTNSSPLRIVKDKTRNVPHADLLRWNLTDSGNGERFVKVHGRDVKYCHERKAWYVFSEGRWQRDIKGLVHRMAKETARRLYLAALSIAGTDKDRAARVEAFARQSESSQGIKATLECAKHEPDVSISANEFDRDPWLLNCRNGTVDLRIGELRQHQPTDMLTKMCAVEFDKDADCPQFMAFLEKIMNGNQALIAYLQRVLGYAITGTVGEKAVFCFYGDGDNGKTTLLETVRYIVGDYGGLVMIESLLKRNSSANSTAIADLAGLQGLRFVITSEANQHAALAEGQLKALTGGGWIKGCKKYENPVEFPPTHKIFMDSNYRPSVTGRDHGIWSRLKVAPFDVQIREHEKIKDLMERLKVEEGPGILRWITDGCVVWREAGLMEPAEVTQSVAEWKSDSDPFEGFFESRCELSPAVKCPSADLTTAYEEYAKAEGIPVEIRQFTDHLKRLGCIRYSNGTTRFWKGIRLKPDTTDTT